MISQTAPVADSKSASPKPGQMEDVLNTDRLVKIYGGRAVVDGVNLEVKAGEIVGLLGPNGAGKTTSFYMIVGLVRPNSGDSGAEHHGDFGNTVIEQDGPPKSV